MQHEGMLFQGKDAALCSLGIRNAYPQNEDAASHDRITVFISCMTYQPMKNDSLLSCTCQALSICQKSIVAVEDTIADCLTYQG